MTTIRIRQYSFDITDRYSAGHTCTPGEAQALNRLRAENIRNNMAPAVAEAADTTPDRQLSGPGLDSLRQRIARYDANYEFVEKHTPSRPGALETELLRVATEQVEADARALGKDLTVAQIVAMAKLMLGDPKVQAEARSRLAERQRIAQSALDDLL